VSIEAGRISAVDLGRRFQITSGAGRTLKGTFLRREVNTTRDFWALRHLDLEIGPGETIGIVGRNGSGKSTLLKMLARIYGPSEGSCRIGGRVSSLLELGAGFHPEFSAVENIYLAGAIYGIPKAEIKRNIEEMLAFAEIERFANQPIKTFSSGMFARLGFAVAMYVEPDVLLLDEVLAVGDEAFVQKCLGRLTEHKRRGGTIVFISHDPHAVETLCHRAIILDHGSKIFEGTASDAIVEYHRRLVNEESRVHVPEGAESANSDVDVQVTVRDANEAPIDRAMEGDPICITVSLTPKTDIPSARVTIGLRIADGYGFGNQTLEGVDLRNGSTWTGSLRFDKPPFRQGLFTVGVMVQSADESHDFAKLENLAQFSIYSTRTNAQGPIFLNGVWNR
jgi:ABC-type polysaccharide/polyol phosphate transport system ATPase subunit